MPRLVFGSPSDLADAVYVGLWSAGTVALGVALSGCVDMITGTRLGRIGMRLALVGLGLLGLLPSSSWPSSSGQARFLGNFVLFAFGFLLILVGRSSYPRVGPRGAGWSDRELDRRQQQA